MYVTFVGYLWKIQGIFLYSIFPEYYLGIFPGISLGIFSEYSGNMSWEKNIYLPGRMQSQMEWGQEKFIKSDGLKRKTSNNWNRVFQRVLKGGEEGG